MVFYLTIPDNRAGQVDDFENRNFLRVGQFSFENICVSGHTNHASEIYNNSYQSVW